jgi:predicted subunit of tRNA(5-methylaminomethyl-2-thiouridylate) methyltransferase
MDGDIVVLFSGGTDSTLTAIQAGSVTNGKVHLLSFYRFGIFSIENSNFNADNLKQRFHDKYLHKIIRVEKLFRYFSYEKYLRNLLRHKAQVVSVCGLCKLSMHVRAAVYCIDHGILEIMDGANRHMDIYPAQMDSVVKLLKEMYARIGINYSNPVFDLDEPEDIGFREKISFHDVDEEIYKKIFSLQDNKSSDGDTSGKRLFEMGFFPSENVKGSGFDRKIQARCFQFIITQLIAKWLYNYELDDRYKRDTKAFFKEKIYLAGEMLENYKSSGSGKLVKLLED